MRQIFHIKNKNPAPGQQVLCEWGENYCCWGNWDEVNRSLQGFSYYAFDANTKETVSELMQKMSGEGRAQQELIVAAAFPQAVLTPLKFSNKEDFASLVFAQNNTVAFSDNIDNWQMVTQYLVPRITEEAIKNAFAKYHFSHVYSSVIRSQEEGVANALYVHFLPNNFRVLVVKESHVELAQTYAYTAPLDVVYYLLKISEQMFLDKEQTSVILSGLIEENSALYQEVTNYFFEVRFAATPALLSGSDLPAHYFTSLFNLATCALLAAH